MQNFTEPNELQDIADKLYRGWDDDPKSMHFVIDKAERTPDWDEDKTHASEWNLKIHRVGFKEPTAETKTEA